MTNSLTPMGKLLRQARYVASIHNPRELPPDAGVEVAIAGRSNAGKSSLINRLCDQKALARTSKTPGRTRQLVFFEMDPLRKLVDLPGYGYAKVSGDLKTHWQGLIQSYLDHRLALKGLVVVMDIRHPLKDSDRELINWAGMRGLPQHLVLTKADKLKHGQLTQTLAKVRAQVDDAVGVQAFSATTGLGLEQLTEAMAHWYEPDKDLIAG